MDSADRRLRPVRPFAPAKHFVEDGVCELLKLHTQILITSLLHTLTHSYTLFYVTVPVHNKVLLHVAVYRRASVLICDMDVTVSQVEMLSC